MTPRCDSIDQGEHSVVKVHSQEGNIIHPGGRLPTSTEWQLKTVQKRGVDYLTWAISFAEFSDRKGKKSLSFRSVQPFQLIHSNRGLVADWLLSDLMEQVSSDWYCD